MFNKAKEMIDTNKASCVVVKNEEIIYSKTGKGIRPIIKYIFGK